VAALPDAVQALIAALGKLPGVGPRSAERIALHLVQAPAEISKTLADALVHARSTIQFCQNCGALTEKQPCAICSDARRDATLLCVVERAVDILSIERSGSFRGQFHVLGGRISPLNGVGPEDLRIAQLIQRVPQQGSRATIGRRGRRDESLPCEGPCFFWGSHFAHCPRFARGQRTRLRGRTHSQPCARRSA
jgi:recombination protein RecR